MDNISGKWALVTGASSGFGIEFANLLAERKANLILAARRTEPMERLSNFDKELVCASWSRGLTFPKPAQREN